jgi:hypothetical protein
VPPAGDAVLSPEQVRAAAQAGARAFFDNARPDDLPEQRAAVWDIVARTIAAMMRPWLVSEVYSDVSDQLVPVHPELAAVLDQVAAQWRGLEAGS